MESATCARLAPMKRRDFLVAVVLAPLGLGMVRAQIDTPTFEAGRRCAERWIASRVPLWTLNGPIVCGVVEPLPERYYRIDRMEFVGVDPWGVNVRLIEPTI
jgi:hypothetical protein